MRILHFSFLSRVVCFSYSKDTQGFEPSVFSGLTESIKNHKIDFILTEFWPKGIDFLADKPGACVGVDFLTNLANQGYTLYALDVQAHPKAPRGWKNAIVDRPLDNLRSNCQWFLDLEKLYPSDVYHMGYWSDVLAVAPGARMDSATTRVGRILTEELSKKQKVLSS